MSARRAAAALAASAAMVVIAACGSSGGGRASGTVDPVHFAGALCRAVAPFERDIYTGEQALDLTSAGTVAAHKQALQELVAALRSSTASAKEKIHGAGVPGIDGGAQLATSIVRLLGNLETTLQSLSTQVDALPTSSEQAFRAAATPVLAQIRSSVGDLSDGLDHVSTSALEAAARKAPDCTSLGG